MSKIDDTSREPADDGPANRAADPGARITATGDWAAYGAAVLAGVSGIISVSWSLGGTLGIRTVGGQIADMAVSHSPGAALLAWGASLIKIIGVVFAVALTQRSRWSLPRRILLILGWLGATVLAVYGALNIIGAFLALTSLVDAGQDIDRYALSWHLGLWDPLFLVWGILLGVAVRHFQRRNALLSGSHPGVPGRNALPGLAGSSLGER